MNGVSSAAMKGTILGCSLALAALTAGVGCGKDEAKKAEGGGDKPGTAAPAKAKAMGCGLPPAAIAGWLTTQRLGAELGGTPSAARKTALKVNEALVGLAGYAAWCDAQAKRVPESCLEASSAGKMECEGPLAAIGGLRVTGESCATELDAQGVGWLAEADLGPRPAEGDPGLSVYDDKVAALRTRLAGVVYADLCNELGGVPLACFGGGQHADCKTIVDRMRGALTPAAPPPGPPAGPT